jgi:hypothetical protein
MPSRVDPNHPATGVAVSKAASRANWAAAKSEIEHGGFFIQAGTGALERPVADRLAETISARDFSALGDGSVTTVEAWLAGGQYSRGAADLAELRAMTGIADLELIDTIDWATITAAKEAAGARPVFLPQGNYNLSRPLVFEQGGLQGEVAGIPADDTVVRLSPTVGGAHDVIQLTPSLNNRPFFFSNLYLQAGLRGLYASADVDDRRIWQQSVFDNIRIAGAQQDGFFFDKLWAIGVLFTRIRVETCGGSGIRFTGQSQLNGAQIVNARAANCEGTGMLFENTGAVQNTPAVALFGCIAEWNHGPGIHFKGYNATLYDPYLEGNDNDQDGDGPELVLSSNPNNTIPSQITAIGAYFGPMRHPDNVRVGTGTGGTQVLTFIEPKFAGTASVIDATKLDLKGIGVNPRQVEVRNSTHGLPMVLNGIGLNTFGCRRATTTPFSTGILAAAPSGKSGLLLVMAAKTAGDTALYMVRHDGDATLTPTLVAGSDILTFGVDAGGKITVATTSGTATFSVMGY